MFRLPPVRLSLVLLASFFSGAGVSAAEPATHPKTGVGSPSARPDSAWVAEGVARHPLVREKYLRRKAAEAAVAPAGALPDPKLTLQADIVSSVMSLMPGLMFDLMNGGTRAAQRTVAASQVEVARREYLVAVAEVASGVRAGAINLARTEADLGLLGEQRALLQTRLSLSRTALEADAQGGAAALVGAEDRLAALDAEFARTVARRSAERARFKTALGLGPDAAAPAADVPLLVATEVPTEEELWQRIEATNPELGRMRAAVDLAVAAEALARRGNKPELAVGLMADVKAAPWMWRPSASLSLPIWRKKVAGQIAVAEAMHAAEVEAVQSRRLDLAAALARALSEIRSADATITYIDESGLPSAAQRVQIARNSVESGMGELLDLLEPQLMAVSLRRERLAALAARELAVVDLLRMAAALPETE